MREISVKVQHYQCPACKQRTGVEILYGMPTPELIEAAQRLEVALGGCSLTAGMPHRECTTCGHQWRIKRHRPAWLPEGVELPPEF